MKWRTVVVSIFAFFAIGAAISWFLPQKPYTTRTLESMATIARILSDVDMLRDETIGITNFSAASDEESLTINRRLATLFQTSADKGTSVGRAVAADGLFHDAWGTPLILIHTNNPSYERINPKLQGRSRPIVIWSAGPNKTNEFGYGDDVFSYR